MISFYIFLIAVGAALVHYAVTKKHLTELLLLYIIFLNMGLMGLLAAYAHVFMGPETAEKIGWQPGSPFQFEIGMANLSYGILGILAFFLRGRAIPAAVVAWSFFLLGCFVGHIHNYIVTGNAAPYNFGPFIWFYDLFLPLLTLSLLTLRAARRQ